MESSVEQNLVNIHFMRHQDGSQIFNFDWILHENWPTGFSVDVASNLNFKFCVILSVEDSLIFCSGFFNSARLQNDVLKSGVDFGEDI